MQMTYFAQISDPRFGGSYMSLFNTISNLGHNMYVSPVLSLIDLLSRWQCVQWVWERTLRVGRDG